MADLQAKLRKLKENLKQAKSKDESNGDAHPAEDKDKDDDKELIYEDSIEGKDDKDDDLDVIAVSSSMTTVDDKSAWLIGKCNRFDGILIVSDSALNYNLP